MLINIKPSKLKAEETQEHGHKHLLQLSVYHQLLILRQWKSAAEIMGFIRGCDELFLMDGRRSEATCHLQHKAVLKIK